MKEVSVKGTRIDSGKSRVDSPQLRVDVTKSLCIRVDSNGSESILSCRNTNANTYLKDFGPRWAKCAKLPNHPSLMKQKGLKPQNSSFSSSSSKRKKEQKERKERKEMRVVVVVPPSSDRKFHTGAPIDAPFVATRSSQLPLRFYLNN
ncbi:hypothetical protein PIB30_104067 [Stylosanthes scabra]|uniref:Uncharacterized protein n=1 Tax=Stylosanthes scabra TaxID=79078 RepID=A0ABU6SZG4_9FABA|nr:hypothetical protein [Stylosanthes scabra]